MSNSFEDSLTTIYGVNVNPWIYEALMDQRRPFNDDYSETVLYAFLPRAHPIDAAEKAACLALV